MLTITLWAKRRNVSAAHEALICWTIHPNMSPVRTMLFNSIFAFRELFFLFICRVSYEDNLATTTALHCIIMIDSHSTPIVNPGNAFRSISIACFTTVLFTMISFCMKDLAFAIFLFYQFLVFAECHINVLYIYYSIDLSFITLPTISPMPQQNSSLFQAFRCYQQGAFFF